MRKYRHILLLLCGAAILAGCGVRHEKPAGSREPIMPYPA